MYENKNENMQMDLKEKRYNIKMAKGESMAYYLTQIGYVKDELSTIREMVLDSKLVCISLKGFTK